MSKLNIALFDQHRLLGEALDVAFQGHGEFQIIGNFHRLENFVKYMNTHKVDMVLCDIAIPKEDPFHLISTWVKEYPEVMFLLLTGLNENIYAERLVRLGCAGFVPKTVSLEEVFSAIRQVCEGELALNRRIANRILAKSGAWANGRISVGMNEELDRLSNREFHVLSLISQGKATSEISKDMGVSIKTVDSHKERMKNKLQLKNSMQLAQYAVRAFDH